jgi:hypothetical protein
MGLLDQLMGGGAQQDDFQDFVKRYQQGSPEEGYSDQEVLKRYQQVAPNVSQQDYVQAAQQAFERLTPEQRAQFAQYLQQQAQQQNVPLKGLSDTDGEPDSGSLAKVTGQLHQQEPGLLGQLLGGGGGGSAAGMLNNPIAKAALAGIAAMAAQRLMNRK